VQQWTTAVYAGETKAVAPAWLLLSGDYEKDEAQAEALRRGYTPSEINDARRRLRRHLANIVAEEETKR
jgi:hypothetical protein